MSLDLTPFIKRIQNSIRNKLNNSNFIKIIRDINWAHVHKIGMKDSELMRLKQFNKNDYPKEFSLIAKLEYDIIFMFSFAILITFICHLIL